MGKFPCILSISLSCLGVIKIEGFGDFYCKEFVRERRFDCLLQKHIFFKSDFDCLAAIIAIYSGIKCFIAWRRNLNDDKIIFIDFNFGRPFPIIGTIHFDCCFWRRNNNFYIFSECRKGNQNKCENC